MTTRHSTRRKAVRFLWSVGVPLLIFAVPSQASSSSTRITIADASETRLGAFAASELQTYLTPVFEGVDFDVIDDAAHANIRLVLDPKPGSNADRDHSPHPAGSFSIEPQENALTISSPDERGLLNGVYALLDELGYGFYISGDVRPEPREWTGFADWEMEDRPLTGDRFVLNWHNFLSGSTGWNLSDWEQWIDQVTKMRFTGVMVHAYGNNPMFSFDYLGETKQTGYLNNTRSGRDWGNQHVNDVRRLVGGEIFDGPVFGTDASLAADDEKVAEATALMQSAFAYAEERGTDVIFALDFDTWMANPENVIQKLPPEAIFTFDDGHLAVNPDHPAGHAYYRHILETLVETYPEVDQLSVWHRRAGSNTVWMSFPYERFPDDWKREYRARLAANSHLEDGLTASSMFAYGKLIAALQKARDEVEPELEISSGSWSFHYVPYAHAFFPPDVPLLPLDWEVVFDRSEAQQILARAGEEREMYPILWAHHDDHRYIGRPYTPWPDLADRISDIDAVGFGIIHWTTRPLDLYFTNSARQIWSRTKNEDAGTTGADFVSTVFGDAPRLEDYYGEWATSGPMFGRETSDHFIDLGEQRHGHELPSWTEMLADSRRRTAELEGVLVPRGDAYLQYQRGMESFYQSFFENQIRFQRAYEHLGEHRVEEAADLLRASTPEETIRTYVDAVNHVGFTRGEKALVFSMNTRWLVDFYNLEQRAAIRPVRFRFSPTQHDPLAQAPGRYTYFIDDEGAWWRSLWEHELPEASFTDEGLLVDDAFEIELTTMHGQALPADGYTLIVTLNTPHQADAVRLSLVDQAGDTTLRLRPDANGRAVSGNAALRSGLRLRIEAAEEPVVLEELVIQPGD